MSAQPNPLIDQVRNARLNYRWDDATIKQWLQLVHNQNPKATAEIIAAADAPQTVAEPIAPAVPPTPVVEINNAASAVVAQTTVTVAEPVIDIFGELEEQERAVATAPVDVPKGGRFREIALRSAARGERRVLPIAVGGKNPLIKWAVNPANDADGVDTRIDTFTASQWQEVSAAWVEELDAKFPNANAAVVAKPDEMLFTDEDESDRFRRGYEAWAGEPFPRTYTTSARPDRRQGHWLQTEQTRKMGNIPQGDTVDGMLSVRQRNQYVLAEGSRHKNGVDIYKVFDDSPIAPMPDKLVEYIQTLRIKKSVVDDGFEKKPEGWLDAPFIHGNIDNQLIQFAGHYISAKNISDADELEALLISKLEKNGCFYEDGRTPFAYNADRVREIATDKVRTWKTGEQKKAETTLVLNQSTQPPALATTPAADDEAKKPIVTINGDDFLAETIPPRKILVSTISGNEPVIFEQSINQVFAWRGAGKTCLGMGFVRALATAGSFLNFKATERNYVLYVEGELPDSQFQERWKSIVGKTDGYAHMASIDKQPGHHYVSMATEGGMAKIEATLAEFASKGVNIKVLMLDNISTLFNVKANEEEVWIPIQSWFTSLRSRGITVFFFHHAGKGGLSRSHSKSEDMLDVSIKLEEPEEPEQGHLHSLMTFDKARAGLSEKPSEIKLHRTHSPKCICGGSPGILFCPGDGVIWEHVPKVSKRDEAYRLFAEGKSILEVVGLLDSPEGTVRRWRTQWAKLTGKTEPVRAK